MAQSNFIIK